MQLNVQENKYWRLYDLWMLLCSQSKCKRKNKYNNPMQQLSYGWASPLPNTSLFLILPWWKVSKQLRIRLSTSGLHFFQLKKTHIYLLNFLQQFCFSMSNICSQFHTALQFSLFQKKTKKYTFLPSDKWQNWCKWGWGRWITCFFQLLFQTSNLGNCARNFLLPPGHHHRHNNHQLRQIKKLLLSYFSIGIQRWK